MVLAVEVVEADCVAGGLAKQVNAGLLFGGFSERSKGKAGGDAVFSQREDGAGGRVVGSAKAEVFLLQATKADRQPVVIR